MSWFFKARLNGHYICLHAPLTVTLSISMRWDGDQLHTKKHSTKKHNIAAPILCTVMVQDPIPTTWPSGLMLTTLIHYNNFKFLILMNYSIINYNITNRCKGWYSHMGLNGWRESKADQDRQDSYCKWHKIEFQSNCQAFHGLCTHGAKTNTHR